MAKHYLTSYSFSKSHGIIMIPKENEGIEICLNASFNLNALLDIQKQLFNKPFFYTTLDTDSFQQKLTELYEKSGDIADISEEMEENIDLANLATHLSSSSDLLDTQDDAPIIKLINALFTQAIRQNASDIHIETYENQVIVRHRVDGVLHHVLDIQRAIAPLVISRVKVMAKLDIAEKRIPQDGRISLKLGDKTVDVRVSTLPSNHGERIVMRLLDKKNATIDLSYLGINNIARPKINELIKQPHGIILVTGPTGSGKTTSLYAMLSSLNQISRNILTIEDPVEYDLPGIGQTQVNTKVNMTFAKGLRAILRQDPDIVMIGEIRDLETAEIAVQASLTGHLVLSTLHTNSALGAITRLQDMGVESFLLSSSIIGLIAQRLVRKLCAYCKQKHTLTKEEATLMGVNTLSDIIVYQPKGCSHCNQMGYLGRTGIYEVLILDDTIRGMIHRQENIHDIVKYIEPFHQNIQQDGFERVLAGETSLSEILRVTSQNT
jgi:general secretion pathway protein E